MYAEMIVHGVRAMEAELKYQREAIKEQAEIIKQLSGQPTENGITYIHPFDLTVLVDASRAPRHWLEYKDGQIIQNDSVGGVRYKQSIFMPVHFKGIIR